MLEDAGKLFVIGLIIGLFLGMGMLALDMANLEVM